MKTTKSFILKNTYSRGIVNSNSKNYTFQLDDSHSYTKDCDMNVLYNTNQSSERIGYATNKTQFIELVYNHINRFWEAEEEQDRKAFEQKLEEMEG